MTNRMNVIIAEKYRVPRQRYVVFVRVWSRRNIRGVELRILRGNGLIKHWVVQLLWNSFYPLFSNLISHYDIVDRLLRPTLMTHFIK